MSYTIDLNIKAFCLSLDKRKECWVKLVEDAKQYGINCKPFVVGNGEILPKEEYDYIDNPNADMSSWGYGNPKFKINHYNAFMAHKEIFKLAKDENLPYFLMLEDDAYFTQRFPRVMGDYINSFAKLPFDVLYLGWWSGEPDWNKMIEESYSKTGQISVVKAKQLGGLHGAVFSRSIYDYILSLPPIDPIDCQLNRIHSQIASYIITPKCIHTYTMYSNCEGSVIEREYL